MPVTAAETTSPAHDDAEPAVPAPPVVSFFTAPDRYRHWRLEVDGEVATAVLAVDENGGLVAGYELKMNSYDLGVDIELYDLTQRLRFEHPGVKSVVMTGGLERMFCAGANIRMLAQSSHGWKVNFCKFTNETRNGIEDATASSGQTWIAALNGTAAGGGYELALACDQIVLIDDGSSAVSLPEVSLLGVLPGTGGLTRVVDKRYVRKDRADLFATKPEGYRGATAVEWGLVDATVQRNAFEGEIIRRATEAAATSQRPSGARGVELTPLAREDSGDDITYPSASAQPSVSAEPSVSAMPCVSAKIDRVGRRVDITVHCPTQAPPAGAAAVLAQGVDYWPMALTRALDDLILHLRTNEPEIGSWVLRTVGDADQVLAYDAQLADLSDDWFVSEVRHYYKRTLKRLDVTSRSLFAVIEPGSCFVGLLLELALAADRQYMLQGVYEDVGPDAEPATIVLTASNDGAFPMGNGLSRLQSRFWGHNDDLVAVRARFGERLDAVAAAQLGLVTMALDDIDFEDELRVVLEERASLSPDALTGMEANHRFVGPETMETKIFGRLAAWQNWIFIRPNASGPDGALRRFGSGRKGDYDFERI
jgi:benzoyl-CoA-dihydrodiol lyase